MVPVSVAGLKNFTGQYVSVVLSMLYPIVKLFAMQDSQLAGHIGLIK